MVRDHICFSDGMIPSSTCEMCICIIASGLAYMFYHQGQSISYLYVLGASSCTPEMYDAEPIYFYLIFE